jgi:hypothetical protein
MTHTPARWKKVADALIAEIGDRRVDQRAIFLHGALALSRLLRKEGLIPASLDQAMYDELFPHMK